MRRFRGFRRFLVAIMEAKPAENAGINSILSYLLPLALLPLPWNRNVAYRHGKVLAKDSAFRPAPAGRVLDHPNEDEGHNRSKQEYVLKCCWWIKLRYDCDEDVFSRARTVWVSIGSYWIVALASVILVVDRAVISVSTHWSLFFLFYLR